MVTVLYFWSYGRLKLTELTSMEIAGIKHSGNQWFSHTFLQTTSSTYSYISPSKMVSGVSHITHGDESEV